MLNIISGRLPADASPGAGITDSSQSDEDDEDDDDDPRAQQRRQGRKLFKPTPASTTRLAGEHISVTLAPGMKQVARMLYAGQEPLPWPV